MILTITYITDDNVICDCKLRDNIHQFYLDREHFSFDIKIGDNLIHIEHGYCDLYRNDIMLQGLGINYKRAMQSYKEKQEKRSDDI